MPNYSKVQFIAWEIYTGPVYIEGGNGGEDYADHYPGIAPASASRRWDVLSQCLDISARVQFTRMAMETAYQNACHDADTLKIFMAPEFLYRGAAGAYLFDLLNGWAEAPADFGSLPSPYDKDWGGLFGELRALAADPKFQDWVFIFGTAVGADLPCFKGRIGPAAPVTPERPARGYNLSLIQCGGGRPEQRKACYFTEKHLKSGIDFISFNINHSASPVVDKAEIYTDDTTQHTSEPDWKILDRLILEAPYPGEAGGSLFRFPIICKKNGKPIQFGLEICLDHVWGRISGACAEEVTGWLARSDGRADIQLVPSCGMSLLESSLALAPRDGPQDHAYAFNCDGLTGLCGIGYGGHVQLWSGNREPGPGHPPRHLADIADSFQTGGHVAVDGSADLSKIHLDESVSGALDIDLAHIPANRLWYSHMPYETGQDPHQRFWPEGAGFIRVLDAQPLPPEDSMAPDDEQRLNERLLGLIEANLNAFREQYTLSSVRVSGKNVFSASGGFHIDFDVELQAALKYETACRMPLVQGMINRLGINAPELTANDLPSALKSAAAHETLTRLVRPIVQKHGDSGQADSLTAQVVDLAEKKITDFVKSLDRLYIGRVTPINLSFRAAFDGKGTLLSVMATACDGSAYDAKLLVPATSREMRDNGENQLQAILDSAVGEILPGPENDGAAPGEPAVYHKIRARDYANTWTDSLHHSCSEFSDWNVHENPRGEALPCPDRQKGDCASYVSQAIHAGGIPTTPGEREDLNCWFDGPQECSRTWENCAALRAYFTKKQYWSISDLATCDAGGIIFLKDRDGELYHAVMCVYNDTVTKLFSAGAWDKIRFAYTGEASFGSQCSALECWVFKNSTID